MCGVPEDLPVAGFIGATLIQVCIGAHYVQLHFDGSSGELESHEIAIEGAWRLCEQSGAVIGSWTGSERQDAGPLQRLLGESVVHVSVETPESATFWFGNGMSITLLDDQKDHESFHVDGWDV